MSGLSAEDRILLIKARAIITTIINHPESEGWAGEDKELREIKALLYYLATGDEEVEEVEQFEAFPSLSEEKI